MCSSFRHGSALCLRYIRHVRAMRSTVQRFRRGLGDVVSTLITAGCNPEVEDFCGRNLLQMAQNCKKKWVIELVQKRFPHMVATKGKGREDWDRTSGQFRHDVDSQVEHPKGKKRAREKAMSQLLQRRAVRRIHRGRARDSGLVGKDGKTRL